MEIILELNRERHVIEFIQTKNTISKNMIYNFVIQLLLCNVEIIQVIGKDRERERS